MARRQMFCSIAVVIFSCIVITGVQCTNLPPSFSLDINNLVLSETTPVGEVVFTLEGTDPENSAVHFGLHGTDLLSVNRDTGDVTVVKPLDREVNDTLNFFVTIEDEVKDAPLGGNNVVEVPVTVIILDENDNAPVFVDVPYETLVDEDTVVGSTVFSKILINDPDSVGESLEVTCVPLPEFPTACETFSVTGMEASQSSYKGVITLQRPLNYTETDRYKLILKATDGELVSNTTVSIFVGDVQNTPPKFFGDLKAEVYENVPINTLIMTVHAEDGDRQRPRKIVYELVNNPMDYFLLDTITGELRTARPLDREAIENPTGTLLLNIKARELVDGIRGDDPLTVSATEASITVKDVNDEPPTFNRRDYYVEIAENIAEGSPLPGLNMTVQDPDLGTNSVFSLSLNDISGAFSISPDSATGSTDVTIRISNSSLDYENPNQRKFILLVIAKETHTDLLLSSTATVTVTVTDANDNAPTFDQDSYSATISEMATPGTLVTTIVAKDRDSGGFGENGLVYQLAGSGSDKFLVNNRTGTVTVAQCESDVPGHDDCLDYETKSEYLLMFKSTDDDGKGQTTTVPLKIVLTDSNDNSPIFDLPVYRVFIDEGSVRFDPDLVLVARDLDKTSHVSYSIIAGNLDDLFYIDPNTGRVRITNNKGLDMSNDTETMDNIVLTIEANDGKFTTTSLVNITVRDVNNNSPIFEKENYIVSVAEDTLVGTSILRVSASDADFGDNADIDYHLQKGALEDFTIDRKSGVISISTKLDYDRRNTYNIEIMASDNGQPKLSTSVLLTVTVINTNDKLPYFVPATQKAEVLEDAPVGTLVHTLIALDPDVNSSEALNFAATEPITALDKHGRQVIGGRDEFKEFFVVNKNTGKVTVLNPIIRDIAAVVRISVLVTDITASNIQQGQGMLIITIADVNDSPPYFVPPWTPQNPSYNLELKEEQPIGTIVATYTALDEDSDIAGYAIMPPSEYFEINQGTGIIQITKLIDYEQLQHLNFTIHATDSGVPQLSASARVNVTVLNLNDNDPIFPYPSYNVTIDENLPEGSHVITVHAEDKDLGVYGEVSYHLVGEHSEVFEIDRKTGEITVNASEYLDRELIERVVVQVVASDGGDQIGAQRTQSVPVIVAVRDVNDNAPKFNQSEYLARVVENVRLNPPVPLVQVYASDGDVGEYGRVVYRIIAGNDDNVFLLSEENGILYPHKSLMGQTHQFKLLVEARDGNGADALTDRATITVQVENINEHKPRFIMPALQNATVEITENAATTDFLVMTVKATDKDMGENGRVTYHVQIDGENVQETNEFLIDPDTGELRTKMYLDRELQSKYELILVARDHGIPTFYETFQHLTVLLVDTSDNKPEFPDTKSTSPYTFFVIENGSKDVRIGQVKALDKNQAKSLPVYYHIISGNDNHSFYLDRNDGSIYTNKSFDRETQASYTLHILASNNPDLNTPSEFLNKLTVTKNISSHSDTKDDSAIKNQSDRKSQSDRKETNHNNLMTNSLDNLASASSNNDYHNHENSEENSDHNNEHDSDDSGDIATVLILIEDLNDNSPHFPRELYHAAVNAMAPRNAFIANITARDADRGVNGSLHYVITASNLYKYGTDKSSGSIIPSPFNVTGDGMVATATYLAENNQHRFVVDVVAREVVYPEREAMAKVHIWIFEPNQLNRIILSRPVEEVNRERDEIIAELSNATQSLVIIDEIRYHTDDLGRKNDEWSDMYILVVDPHTHTIVPVAEVLRIIDAQYDFLKDYYAGFAIENVVPAFVTDHEESFDPALAALIALLIVLCVGVITFAVVCCCLRHWAISPKSLKSVKKDALIKKAIIDDLNTTENPLWIEQKLKIYEEQELTMQVFNEPEQQNVLVRRDSEDFIPDENTYATIQHPNRRGSTHMATMAMGEEIADYATLSGLPHHSVSTHSTLREAPNYYEAALGFQGSTFQVPESTSTTTSNDFDTFNINRYQQGQDDSSNRQQTTDYVTELI